MRDDNRLTDDDRAMIQARIAETVRNWAHPKARPTAGVVAREGYRAIGCDSRDLRDSELAEVDAMVARALIDGHVNAGRRAFLAGHRRLVPRAILVDEGTDAARAWYRGWDAANLAAPVPEP